MSLNSLASSEQLMASVISLNYTDNQDEIFENIRINAYHMKKALELNKLTDALKSASLMLSELRTSALTPKAYYDVYMTVFDHLRHLTSYLYDGHISKKHHLSELYELVQYAAAIVPRLYLMVAVGSVYLRVSKEITQKSAAAKANVEGEVEIPVEIVGDDVPPIKDLMRDMMEMSRGVQHPTRGLFLRYFLSALTRDFLPDAKEDGYTLHVSFNRPHGTINDSIGFILSNFAEMNKLWVRLQHQGSSKEKDRREQERLDLRVLVGSNLVRLSQLDGLTLDIYQSVLPQVIDEIVNCRDMIAQEYLMEVIVQVFPDEFHLRTLDIFLGGCAKLQTSVDVKQLVVTLIERFSHYAERMREETRLNRPEGEPEDENETGIPKDVDLFQIFWGQIVELVRNRPEFTYQDTVNMLTALANLSLTCYPLQYSYIDSIYGFAKEQYQVALETRQVELQLHQTSQVIQKFILCPLIHYAENILQFLKFPSSSSSVPMEEREAINYLGGNFSAFLIQQPFYIRRKVANEVVNLLVHRYLQSANDDALFSIPSLDGVNFIFGELCSAIVRDQPDGDLYGPVTTSSPTDPNAPVLVNESDDLSLDWEDITLEQEELAKLVHMCHNSIPDTEFMLLSVVKKHLGEGGSARKRFTMPAVVNAFLRLAHQFLEPNAENTRKLNILYRLVHESISILSQSAKEATDTNIRESKASLRALPQQGPSVTQICIDLYLDSAISADIAELEAMAFEFFSQALCVYEESVSDSKEQRLCLTRIITVLYECHVFGFENYEILLSKIIVLCSRLLRRADQCIAVFQVSRLYWAEHLEGREDGKPGYRDETKVLEFVAKAITIADSVMEVGVNLRLLVQILEGVLWYFEKGLTKINGDYISNLINTINERMQIVEAAQQQRKQQAKTPQKSQTTTKALVHHLPTVFGEAIQSDNGGHVSMASYYKSKNVTGTLPQDVLKQFRNILEYIQMKKKEFKQQSLPGISIWDSIELK